MSKAKKEIFLPPGTIQLTSNINGQRINFLKSEISIVYEGTEDMKDNKIIPPVTNITLKGGTVAYPVKENFDVVQRLRA